MPTTHAPDVDLVIAFRASRLGNLSKHHTRQDVRKAEQQYTRLIETLTYAGLKAVGRRGESLGHLLVFVTCPEDRVHNLIRRERQSDFLSGLPVTPVASGADLQPLSSADRLRLIHEYISSTPADGGLGVSPDSPEWDLVESIFPLHNREFNEHWIRAWTPRNIASVQLEKIREQFGDSVALYFAFLSSYTGFLAFPAILGLISHFVLPPYSPIYSIFIAIWSIFFVEWWRVRERILSLRFGTRGSFKVEKRRFQYKAGMSWWVRELRVLASAPVILLFAGILGAILTGIFVVEAFVTGLYTGPGEQLIGFSPTVLFVLLVPQVLAVYQALAVRLTKWENHAHKSTYHASLTLKTFALSAIVAYLGLGLSAFVYVPFGQSVMKWVQALLGTNVSRLGLRAKFFNILNRPMSNSTVTAQATPVHINNGSHQPERAHKMWEMDLDNARRKLNPTRLRDQMFAYTVTGQIVDTFNEVGLPFVWKAIAAFRKSKSTATDSGSKKRVVFEDEKERGGIEERVFLDRVRAEAALPEYDLFVDYNEMVVQFGYVVLWSTIWPLAGVMAFLNNLLEIRSDAFKIAVHNRRPFAMRTDTIGPWLDALTFLTWVGALTNSALVYLFSPDLLSASAIVPADHKHHHQRSGDDPNAMKELLLKAVLVSLVASHGYMLVSVLVRHVVERVWWVASKEVKEREVEERTVKERFLSGVGVGDGQTTLGQQQEREQGEQDNQEEKRDADPMGFWEHDEGLEEIQRLSKEA
ncbi:hypothetical protein K443DRAFT_682955 [Laccaria amethystina LaAM-08-1]|uniref:DUF590-domain-containing protein n=1 Tax=Laccaria amethystina LaAM-08-1 TaxID=1095629 RepID=A0A0C9WJY6_9AGAR|nr:hypothetical protein K443DRAFT_682955 [Laccaria amethystina LaAM-08-1]